MASIRKVRRSPEAGRARFSYELRYLDPDGRLTSMTFRTFKEAQAHKRQVEAAIVRGDYADPRLGKTKVGEFAAEWLATKADRKPKTRSGYESLLRTHILPDFGSKPLAKVRPLDVQRFFAKLAEAGMSSSRRRQIKTVMTMLFESATASHYISRSPVVGIKIQGGTKAEMQFLDAAQVSAVAEAVPERYRALVYLLANGGLRWGEAAALRRGRVNLLKSRVEVREAVSEVDGKLHYGETKTYQTRTVPLPRFLVNMLAEHLDAFTKADPDALVFTSEKGAPLRLPNFRQRVWFPALKAAGLPKSIRIHDLRHTCASILIAAGKHPKAIQHHLGHSSISVTMDRYGHLFPDEGDKIADALDAAFKAVRKLPS